MTGSGARWQRGRGGERSVLARSGNRVDSQSHYDLNEFR